MEKLEFKVDKNFEGIVEITINGIVIKKVTIKKKKNNVTDEILNSIENENCEEYCVEIDPNNTDRCLDKRIVCNP